LEVTVEASIGEVLVSILVQFQIGEFEYTGENSLHHEPINLSELPLMERAEEWGISVKMVSPSRCQCPGHYDKGRQEIQLVSDDAKTFLHGLAHAAMERLSEPTTHIQPQLQEVMAELAAAALHQIIVKTPDEKLSNSYSFILLNAEALDKTPIEACLEVFSETEEIIEYLLG
jgi:hypothetical protein